MDTSSVTRRSCCLLPLLLCGCPGAPQHAPRSATSQPATVRLTILSTNDVHGQLEPLALYTDERPPRRYRVSGAEALAVTIAARRARNPQGTVLVDAGDFMQGSLVSNAFEGAPMRELFAMLGHDAVVIGNHEFDFGPVGPEPFRTDSGQNPIGALQAWVGAAPFPVLSANITRADGSPLPGVRPTTLIERRGIRIGIVGVTTPQTATTTMPAHVSQLRFAPMAAVVRSQARRLRASGAGVVLVVAHAGGSCRRARSGGASPECGAERAECDHVTCTGEVFGLADQLQPGLVDAVVGGHTHRCVSRRSRSGIPVIEAGGRGVAVGHLELEVDPRRNRVVSSTLFPPHITCHDLFSDSGDCEGSTRHGPPRGKLTVNPLLRDPRLHAIQARAARLVQDHLQRLGPRRSRVLAVSPSHMYHRGPSAAVGTLFARAMLQAVPDADVAVVNSGSLRADIPAGPITQAQLYGVFPFDNRLATVQLTGLQVQQMVATLLANSHGVPHVAGLRLQVTCDRSHGGRRLDRITDASGAALDPARVYTVVISDFLLSGGDGLGAVLKPLPQGRKQIFEHRMVREVVVKYLESSPRPMPGPATEQDPAVTTRGCAASGSRMNRLCP